MIVVTRFLLTILIVVSRIYSYRDYRDVSIVTVIVVLYCNYPDRDCCIANSVSRS